ncbi:MAG: hypothetical protein E4H44_00410 [Candidatus Aminicenantes bacterium]|nr:MAG: hypothetical protein E4H44_00410 [Candidatus Aminicenantes bacterium]
MTRNLLQRSLTMVAVLAAALTTAVHAQASVQEQVAALKRTLAENAAEQRKYTWIETTELALNGDVKETNSMSCQYVANDNTPKCTQIGAPPQPKKVRGPLRKKIAKDKINDLKGYMDSVKTLVGKYVPPQQALVQKAQQRGDVAVAPNPSNNTYKVTVSNYIQQGDAVSIIVHDEDHHLASLNVGTWLNDPTAAVSLNVDFTTLSNGVSFPLKKVLVASAKGVVVTITSSNFAKAIAQ